MTSYITGSDGERMASTDSLKILGFYFGKKPDVSEHVKNLIRKFRTRAWTMINLKKADLDRPTLVDLFKVLVRPVLDYAAVVYGPLLNKGQAEEIERLQRQTLKLIFDFNKSYSDIIKENDICTLTDRRQHLLDQFIQKTLENPKFSSKWLPLKETHNYDTRKEKKFVEKPARTERLWKTPLFTMRRRANEIYAH